MANPDAAIQQQQLKNACDAVSMDVLCKRDTTVSVTTLRELLGLADLEKEEEAAQKLATRERADQALQVVGVLLVCGMTAIGWAVGYCLVAAFRLSGDP